MDKTVIPYHCVLIILKLTRYLSGFNRQRHWYIGVYLSQARQCQPDVNPSLTFLMSLLNLLISSLNMLVLKGQTIKQYCVCLQDTLH